jgi:Na+-driven multidrug efflux pump
LLLLFVVYLLLSLPIFVLRLWNDPGSRGVFWAYVGSDVLFAVLFLAFWASTRAKPPGPRPPST